MEQLLDKPQKSYTKLTSQTPEEYVRKHFPIDKGEYNVKYCSVGDNNFRINFYIKENPNDIFSDCYISRSFFVILIKDKNSWKHEIIPDN